MHVRAKFRCQWVKDMGQDGKVVRMIPVTGGSKENESFWKYTPAGELEMQIDNPPASDMFEPGKEYYIDFIPADSHEPSE